MTTDSGPPEPGMVIGEQSGENGESMQIARRMQREEIGRSTGGRRLIGCTSNRFEGKVQDSGGTDAACQRCHARAVEGKVMDDRTRRAST